MADKNPLAGMPLAETLASQMNESLQWMSRMWSGSPALPASAESTFGGQSLPPGLPSILIPTLDPKELDKRINDLKTVEHWLDMNRILLHSTIQTLEMQRNALVALQSMTRSPQPGTSAPGAGQGSAAAAATQPGDAAAGAQPFPFDPAPWWNALQEQFARVAAAAAEPERPGADQPPREADPERPPPAFSWPQSSPEAGPGRKPTG
jgi:hypothetical protein